MQLVEKYRPRAIADFVGLERPRALLSCFAAAPYSSAWLLVGPSGIGKTTIALALAEQIGGELHHIPSRSCDLATVEDVCAKCSYFPWKGDWHFVLVDEADQMSRPAQHAFLSKLDTTDAPVNTVFVFTANSLTAFEDRFLSRCRTVKFSTDGLVDQIAVLLKSIWIGETGNRPAPDFRAIATGANLNIRQAIMDLELEIITCTSTAPQVTIPARPPDDNDMIDSYGLADALGIGVASVYKRLQQGKLPPPIRDKPRMAWRRSEVLAA